MKLAHLNKLDILFNKHRPTASVAQRMFPPQNMSIVELSGFGAIPKQYRLPLRVLPENLYHFLLQELLETRPVPLTSSSIANIDTNNEKLDSLKITAVDC